MTCFMYVLLFMIPFTKATQDEYKTQNEGSQIEDESLNECLEYSLEEHSTPDLRERVLKHHSQFSKLCKAQIKRDASYVKNLKCQLFFPHPYYTIGPVKMEIHEFGPLIVQFHNVLYHKEIDILHDLAAKAIRPAKTVDKVTRKEMYEKNRVADVAWLYHKGNTIIQTLLQRVSMLTDLGTNVQKGEVETFQYSRYKPGGKFCLHTDFMFDKTEAFEGSSNTYDVKSLFGDRIATLMFYISDVKKGGATVFSLVNLTIFPEKGSALFWYNLNDDGSPDYFTQHAGCPVVEGQKVVGNVWIHERGQEFRRPCRANPFRHQ